MPGENENLQNLLSAITLLSLVKDKVERAIEEKKQDIRGLAYILERNNVDYNADPVMSFVEHQLHRELIDSGILPEPPRANEDWDEDIPEAPQAQDGEENEEVEEIEEIDRDETEEDFLPYGANYLTRLTFDRHRMFVMASCEYFIQVLFDFGMSKVSNKHNAYYSSVIFLQQAVEKFLKLIFLCTERRKYYKNQNNHILHLLAQEISVLRKVELISECKRLEYLNPEEDQYFYSSLCVRSRYPPKTRPLLFSYKQLPCHRFNRESARIANEAFLQIMYISSQALVEEIYLHFPDGIVYLPSINANISILGTEFYSPEDFKIEFL